MISLINVPPSIKIKFRLLLMNPESNVYNGIRKVNEPDVSFMSKCNIKEAIMSIKTKNCEGYDWVPQRILTDGIDHLLKPLSALFDKIYKTKELPEQRLIANIIPVLKKVHRLKSPIIGQLQTFAQLPKYSKN